MGKRGLLDRVPEKIEPAEAGPVSAEDALVAVAEGWQRGKNPYFLSEALPGTPRGIARMWIEHQEPMCVRTERAQLVPKKDGSGVVWKTPYVDRIKFTLTIFLTLDLAFQELILAAAEEKIFWRGEDRKFFLRVIKGNDEMKQDPDYRKNVFQNMRRCLGSAQA